MNVRESGFTMVELLVVIGFMAVCLLLAGLLMRPASFEEVNQNSERRLELAALAQAFSQYKVEHGAFPEGIPATNTLIATTDKQYSPCSALVPHYIPDIPLDPVFGIKFKDSQLLDPEKGAACNQKDVQYTSGYAIELDKSGKLTLSAEAATGVPLTLTVE